MKKIDDLQLKLDIKDDMITGLNLALDTATEMIKSLIKEKKYTAYCAYADNGWSHEESTRKAREEVKAELELLQKVRKMMKMKKIERSEIPEGEWFLGTK